MDSGTYGFFLGAAPGFAYIFRTLISVQRVLSRAKALAREHGEFLDLDSAENQNFDFLLSPGKFIKPGDGPGVRQGKELLLSIRSDMFRRHWIGLVLVVVGIFLGLGISTGVDLLMAKS
jgi:hypothetical protein